MPVRDKPAPFFPQIMMTIFQVQTMFKKEKEIKKKHDKNFNLINEALRFRWVRAPQKMVKFNPGLSQISSKMFLSKNMQFKFTKYC